MRSGDARLRTVLLFASLIAAVLAIEGDVGGQANPEFAIHVTSFDVAAHHRSRGSRVSSMDGYVIPCASLSYHMRPYGEHSD